ncbi:hypothetical protein ABFX02_08G109200 [Erythranthe guttata]
MVLSKTLPSLMTLAAAAESATGGGEREEMEAVFRWKVIHLRNTSHTSNAIAIPKQRLLLRRQDGRN